MKIATVAVYVENQEKAADFWTNKVGFVVHNKQQMTEELSWIEVGAKDAESCIVIYPKSMMEDWNERKPSVVFESTDIDKQYKDMSGNGVEFTQPPKEMPWGKFAMFIDTEGNWFGLRQAATRSATNPEQSRNLQRA